MLFLLSIVLAVAETALTRMSKAKAQALAETNGKRGEVLLSLVEDQEWLNPMLLVVLSTQLVQSTLLGVLAGAALRRLGRGRRHVVNVALFFVVAEAAPKTWAIQHTDRAALAAARPDQGARRLGPAAAAVPRADRAHQRPPPRQGPQARARSSRRRSCSPSPTWRSRTT